MLVKFTQDYCGRETANKPMAAGETMELFHQAAVELIEMGVAEAVEEKATHSAPALAPAPRAKRNRPPSSFEDEEDA